MYKKLREGAALGIQFRKNGLLLQFFRVLAPPPVDRGTYNVYQKDAIKKPGLGYTKHKPIFGIALVYFQ